MAGAPSHVNYLASGDSDIAPTTLDYKAAPTPGAAPLASSLLFCHSHTFTWLHLLGSKHAHVLINHTFKFIKYCPFICDSTLLPAKKTIEAVPCIVPRVLSSCHTPIRGLTILHNKAMNHMVATSVCCFILLAKSSHEAG